MNTGGDHVGDLGFKQHRLWFLCACVEVEMVQSSAWWTYTPAHVAASSQSFTLGRAECV